MKQCSEVVKNDVVGRLIVDLQVKTVIEFFEMFFKLFTMKRIVLTTALILIISLTTFANQLLFQGHSNSQFGDYTITKLDNRMPFRDKELDLYQITYENNGLTVIVAIDKLEKCKKYYVLSEKLPMQYECNGVTFGVKLMDNALLYNGFPITLDIVNKSEFYSQRVIARGVTNTLDHLNLIASYYPGLYRA